MGYEGLQDLLPPRGLTPIVTTDPPETFTGDISSLPEGSYDGDCPYCGESFYLNVWKYQFGYCEKHEVRWPIGYNIFSSWQHEDEETWRRNAEQISTYREVGPWVRWRPEPPTEDLCPTCGQMRA
jgi:hypothetical protein